MQATLLSLAIAIILAVLTALLGPLFIDWTGYRAEIETRARALTGFDLHVTGPVEARLLPTPTLLLQGVQLGRGDEAISARALRLEFSLAALARGEWRLSDARVEGPQFTASLDQTGSVAFSLPQLKFPPQRVVVEHLSIEDGRAVFADAASGARLALDRFEFKGELRSLAGPVKGTGSFVVDGRRFPYRLTTGRLDENGAVRVRLALDPIGPVEQPLTAEADLAIAIEQGKPRFEGTLQLTRAVGRAGQGDAALLAEPWKLSGRITGDSGAAALEQIEFQYGPEERATRLRGNGQLSFGSRPQLVASFTSPQLDLDHVLEAPQSSPAQPIAVLARLAQWTTSLKLPVPVDVSLGADTITLGGATLTRALAVLRADAAGLEVRSLEFHVPGATQIAVKGRIGRLPHAASAAEEGRQGVDIEFAGSTNIEAGDAGAFITWLTGRGDVPSIAAPLRLAADVALARGSVTLQHLDLAFEHTTLAGRIEYNWPAAGREARLAAELSAAELDIDRALALIGVLNSAGFERPRESRLALTAARATLAGVEAKALDAKVRLDPSGIEVERLSVEDFGGTKAALAGRLDSAAARRGSMTLDIDARSLDGIAALIERVSSEQAGRLRRVAAMLAPLSLRAVIALEPAGAETAAKFKLEGRGGPLRLALRGNAVTPATELRMDNLRALAATRIDAEGQLDTDDGAALLEVLRLDRLIAVTRMPGRLALTARGPLDGELAVNGQLTAGALKAAAGGMLRLADRGGAKLDLRVEKANLRAPRGSEVLPAAMNARLSFDNGMVELSDLKGMVAGTALSGRLGVGVEQPHAVEGELELGALDLPPVLAAAIGMPAAAKAGAAGNSSLWPAEPFEETPLRLHGGIAFKAARVALSPRLAMRDVTGVLRFADGEIACAAVEGHLAGGRMSGELAFKRAAEGVSARGHINVASAQASELTGDGLLSGRVTLELMVEGSGLSPVALAGSLSGGGSFTLENGRLGRLDPAAFPAVIRAVDQGLPIDAERLRPRLEIALATGALSIPRGEGAITIASGQARLPMTELKGEGADLEVSGSVNVVDAGMDARLTLRGMPTQVSGARPQVSIALKGPFASPKRTIDASALASWLALRAVEQQAKQIDVLEGREASAAPIAHAPPPVTPPAQDEIAPATAAPAAAPANAAPANAASTPTPAPKAAPAEVGTPRPPVAPSRPAQAAPVKPKPPATAEARPLDLRPAAAPPRPQWAAPVTPPRPAPPPARPRSLSDMLFGR